MKWYMENRKNNNCKDCNAVDNRDYGLNFWEDSFEDFFKPMAFPKTSSMRTDIKENENGYELAVDMPGFDKKDIGVTLKDGYLTIEAKKEDKEEEGKKYLRRERSFSCSRSFYVGDNITEEDVKAKYDNGVLKLEVPKKQEKEIHTGNITIE